MEKDEKQQKEYIFTNECVYCGKKFQSENFFIDVCPHCQVEYADFLLKSHKKLEKDWY